MRQVPPGRPNPRVHSVRPSGTQFILPRHIADTYIAHKAMPADPRGDALHLALASVAKCDILLSWNCRHIVNPRKAEHIETLNTQMHLHIPRLFTPFELLKMERKNEN